MFEKADLMRRHSFSSVYENIPPGGYHNQAAVASEAPPTLQRNQRYYSALPASVHNGIPGVFNCRFTNPYMAAMQKRKKKKPTTFVPPPSNGSNTNTTTTAAATTNGRDSVAFWCKPPPSVHSQQGSSENDESAGSHVDIRQKLQEKKQNQLAELRAIEEEIRQGKLKEEPAGNGEVLLSPQGYLQRQNWIAPPVPPYRYVSPPTVMPNLYPLDIVNRWGLHVCLQLSRQQQRSTVGSGAHADVQIQIAVGFGIPDIAAALVYPTERVQILQENKAPEDRAFRSFCCVHKLQRRRRRFR